MKETAVEIVPETIPQKAGFIQIKFVKGATIPKVLKKKAVTGKVKTPAKTEMTMPLVKYLKSLTEILCLNFSLNLFKKGVVQPESNTPNVEKTERRKLKEVIIYGLFKVKIATPKPKELSESCSSLKKDARRTTAIIIEALITDGVKAETMHNPQRNNKHMILRSFSLVLKSFRNALIEAHQIPVWSPDTASK